MPQRKNKAPKDPNAPKRPQSSYFLYSNERRPKLREQYTDKKVTEISKLISVEWKNMKEEEKKPYEERAKVLKSEYGQKMEVYKKTDGYAEHQRKLKRWKAAQKEENGAPSKGAKKGGAAAKKPKKPSDENAPKRPKSSFFFFTHEQRAAVSAANPDKKVTEIAKLMGAAWKALSPDERKPYEIKAKEAKELYKIDFEKYKQTEQYTQYLEKLERYKKAVKAWEDSMKHPPRREESVSSEDSSSSGDSSSDSDSSSSSDSDSSSSDSDSD